MATVGAGVCRGGGAAAVWGTGSGGAGGLGIWGLRRGGGWGAAVSAVGVRESRMAWRVW